MHRIRHTSTLTDATLTAAGPVPAAVTRSILSPLGGFVRSKQPHTFIVEPSSFIFHDTVAHRRAPLRHSAKLVSSLPLRVVEHG
jgi:hypothetical protein